MNEYQSKINKLFEQLGIGQIMQLATSLNDKVFVRSMSVIICNQKFYFQTDKTFNKYLQLSYNENVALCFNNIHIEGTARELGHPLKSENLFFTDKYKECFPGSYEKYTHLSNEVLFEITPSFITVWDYDNGKPFREFFDCSNEIYKKLFYNSI